MEEAIQPCTLTTSHARAGLRLSRLANWNQTLRDWEFLLREGHGVGMQTPAGLLVSTMVALPLGPGHGWISMVLTDPDWRRRGLAKQLMASGIEFLEQGGLTPTLDATPDGECVYRSIGFSGDTELARWKVSFAPAASGPVKENGTTIRLVSAPDINQLAAWDRDASGCDRAAILGFLRDNQPKLAHIAEDGEGNLQGYIMGRSGDRLPQIGPLVARDPDTAALLLQSAAATAHGPFYLDVFEHHQPRLEAGLKGTWSRERGFKRLLKGVPRSPENPETVFLAAGPELS